MISIDKTELAFHNINTCGSAMVFDGLYYRALVLSHAVT